MSHLDIVGFVTLQGQKHLHMTKNGSLQTEGQNEVRWHICPVGTFYMQYLKKWLTATLTLQQHSLSVLFYSNNDVWVLWDCRKVPWERCRLKDRFCTQRYRSQSDVNWNPSSSRSPLQICTHAVTREVLNSKWSPHCGSRETHHNLLHLAFARTEMTFTLGLDLMSWLTLIVPERTHPPSGIEWHSCIDCMDRKRASLQENLLRLLVS